MSAELDKYDDAIITQALALFPATAGAFAPSDPERVRAQLWVRGPDDSPTLVDVEVRLPVEVQQRYALEAFRKRRSLVLARLNELDRRIGQLTPL